MSDPTYGPKPLGDYLRRLRLVKLTTAAEAAGVSKGYLSQIETGSLMSPPSVKVLAKLARYYRVPLRSLVVLAVGEQAAEELLPAAQVDQRHAAGLPDGWADCSGMWEEAEAVREVADLVEGAPEEGAPIALHLYVGERRGRVSRRAAGLRLDYEATVSCSMPLAGCEKRGRDGCTLNPRLRLSSTVDDVPEGVAVAERMALRLAQMLCAR